MTSADGSIVAIPAPPPPALGLPPAGYGYPKPRQRWWQWVINAIAALVILAAPATAIVFRDAAVPSATWVRGPDAPAPLPKAFDGDGVWNSWAKEEVGRIVTLQSKAMIAGDKAAFLAPADPDNSALRDDLTRRYDTLRAMGLGVWRTVMVPDLSQKGNRRWEVTLGTAYCFGPPTCVAASLLAHSEWTVKDQRLVLSSLSTSTTAGPRPWEAPDVLTIKTGNRVILGAPKSLAWRLPAALTAAEKAATVADQFAKWSPAPDKYVIFFADNSEWRTWYGADQPDWAAAVTIPVGATVSEVVIRDAAVRQSDIEFLLAHELTHVTSLAGKQEGAYSATWWLAEGIAEYAAMLGKPISSYDGLVPTRWYVKGQWDGNPATAPPGVSTSDEVVAGKYGVSFLAVRSIATKYGQDKMLDFFGKMVHDNASIEDASTSALGAPWSSVSKDVAAFIRQSV